MGNTRDLFKRIRDSKGTFFFSKDWTDTLPRKRAKTLSTWNNP